MALVVKNLPANAGDEETQARSLRLEDPLEEGMVILQYYCLENPMDRGAWQAKVHMVAKNQIQLKWLRMHTDKHNHSKHNLSVCLF